MQSKTIGELDAATASSVPSAYIEIEASGVSKRTTITEAETAYTVPARGSTGTLAATGIKFPASQTASTDANTLDDYEENVWTPTLIGSVTAGSQTYVYQVGTYVKIGKLVYIQGHVEISAKDAAMAGNLRIGGLPFGGQITANAYNAIHMGRYFGLTFTSGTQLIGYMGDSSPTNGQILLYTCGSGVAFAAQTVANTAASTAIFFSGCYIATA